MKNAKYPYQLGDNPNITSDQAELHFQKFLLASRVGAVRVNFLAMKTLMALYLLGSPNLWSVLLDWESTPALLSIVPLVLTVSVRKINILSYYWGRLFIGLIHIAHGLMVYSLHGFNILPFIPFYLMVVITLFDTPGNKFLLIRYLGTQIASFAVIIILEQQGGVLWIDDYDVTRNRMLSWLLLISILCYLLHNVHFIQRRIEKYFASGRSATYGLKKCIDLIENPQPFFWVQSIVVVYFAYLIVGFTYETSLASPNLTIKQVIVPATNFLFSVIILGTISITRKIPQPLQYLMLLNLILVLHFGLTNQSTTPLLDNFFANPFLILLLLKPRWVNVGILVFLLYVIALPLIITVEIVRWHEILISFATVMGFVGYLMNVRLRQLSVINHLLQNHSEKVISADIDRPDISTPSENKHGITSLLDGFGLYLSITFSSIFVLSVVGYFTMTNNYRNKLDALANELAEEIVQETKYLKSELYTISLSKRTNIAIGSELIHAHWCEVFQGEISILSGYQNEACRGLDIASIPSKTLAQDGTFNVDDSMFLVLHLDDGSGAHVFGILPLANWIDDVIQSHAQSDVYGMALSLQTNKDVFVPIKIKGTLSNIDKFTPILTASGQPLFYLYLGVYRSTLTWFWLIVLQLTMIIIFGMLVLYRSNQKSKKFMVVSERLDTTTSQLDAIETLSNNLREALNDAELANQAKERFLNVIGHEIRTPLNAMLGMIQAQNYYHMSPKVQGLSHNAQVSGKVLLNLVNDILDFSKMKTNQLSIFVRPFSLQHLCEQIEIQYRDVIELKGLTFQTIYDIPQGLILMGDENRLRQVVSNLLSNAQKFTTRGTVTFKALAVIEHGQCHLTLTVSDTGVGIKPENQKIILEPFTQVDMDPNRLFMGTGLGLSIVQQILEKMSGTLDISSKFGAGATFTVHVDLQVSDLEHDLISVDEVEEQLPDQAIYTGSKILVVDDDFINAMVIQELLTPLGVEVLEATDYSSALNAISSSDILPNFVLMDQQMPEISGGEMTILLRKIYSAEILPIIGFTADLPDNVRKQMLDAGMNECITKPVTMTKLKDLLDIHFLQKKVT